MNSDVLGLEGVNVPVFPTLNDCLVGIFLSNLVGFIVSDVMFSDFNSPFSSWFQGTVGVCYPI